MQSSIYLEAKQINILISEKNDNIEQNSKISIFHLAFKLYKLRDCNWRCCRVREHQLRERFSVNTLSGLPLDKARNFKQCFIGGSWLQSGAKKFENMMNQGNTYAPLNFICYLRNGRKRESEWQDNIHKVIAAFYRIINKRMTGPNHLHAAVYNDQKTTTKLVR